MVFTARTFKRRLTKKKSRKSRKSRQLRQRSRSRISRRKQLGGNVLDSRLQEQYPDEVVIADAMEVEDAPGS
jgi:hypothetical protein